VPPFDQRTAGASSATATVLQHLDELEDRWAELCRWHPAQPPDAQPTTPRLVLTAIADALRHPQPLGWGLDPALEPVVAAFADNVASPDQTIAQLACLRLALHDVVVLAAPPEERDETLERVTTVVDHTMMMAGRVRTSQLHDEALTDGLTRLGNRRAFDRDLEREIARAARSESPITLAIIDLDGLKRINDVEGHSAGDRAIMAMSAALGATARRSDRAYRIGGDEFAVLFTDAVLADPEGFARRLREAGAPTFSVGLASSPPDPADELFERADAALYRERAERRRQPGRQ
jgi:diguanylate cyclase (GGDEF)-like protein